MNAQPKPDRPPLRSSRNETLEARNVIPTVHCHPCGEETLRALGVKSPVKAAPTTPTRKLPMIANLRYEAWA